MMVCCNLRSKAYEAGLYAAIWPVEFGGTPPEARPPAHLACAVICVVRGVLSFVSCVAYNPSMRVWAGL